MTPNTLQGGEMAASIVAQTLIIPSQAAKKKAYVQEPIRVLLPRAIPSTRPSIQRRRSLEREREREMNSKGEGENSRL